MEYDEIITKKLLESLYRGKREYLRPKGIAKHINKYYYGCEPVLSSKDIEKLFVKFNIKKRSLIEEIKILMIKTLRAIGEVFLFIVHFLGTLF